MHLFVTFYKVTARVDVHLGGEEPAYLHEFEQETWFDGDSEVVPGGVFARNGRQEGVPDGTRSFHSLL